MITQKERAWLLAEKYAEKETPEFFVDLKRLAKGEPLAYVIGHIPFLGATIDLSYHPLIPRTETEYWVKEAMNITRVEHPDGNFTALDLFAGSGCIGVALLLEFPTARVDFGEHDKNLLAQIEKNITLNKIKAPRARIIETDVFSNTTDIYDYIFANPPYIPLSHKETIVEESVRAFEPEQALYGGDDGLFYIQKLLNETSKHLSAGGKLFMEFDTEQKDAIEQLIRNNPSWNTVDFMKDQYGLWRTAILTRC